MNVHDMDPNSGTGKMHEECKITKSMWQLIWLLVWYGRCVCGYIWTWGKRSYFFQVLCVIALACAKQDKIKSHEWQILLAFTWIIKSFMTANSTKRKRQWTFRFSICCLYIAFFSLHVACWNWWGYEKKIACSCEATINLCCWFPFYLNCILNIVSGLLENWKMSSYWPVVQW